ncbi:hypothetical protein MYAM1_002166 [Malassezia yamatoensis]|uniref:Urea transporter n=1 Tax=Malassezia yamatoensis TaxID=253288 RepID=A0AAJ5YTD1_9BASI|nr:hypothetical protein MYAM1_002166 [Malassezia yamatoensis]
MSSSLLESYPQLALIPNAGVLGLAAYCFATIAPVWAFGLFGPLIRRMCPDGFTLSEFIRRRYGWPIGVFSALVFIGFMFCFMIVELNTYGSILYTLQPNLGASVQWVGPLIIAITTTIYTAYGGFKASLWTDNFNAICVLVLIIIAGAMIGTRLDIDHDLIESSGLLRAQKLGGELWYILPVSIVFSQMFNQGFWQRAFASKNNQSLYLSVALASIPLFGICFVVGMAGPVAQWAGIQQPPTDDDDGSYALFYILGNMPNWVTGIVLALTGVLSSSAYDTFQSAQISVIQSDLFLGRVNIWWCRMVLLLLNVPCVALAAINIDILQVFVVADLAGLAIIPAVFLGLIPSFYYYRGIDVFVGGCGGFLTLFVFGTIYYHGDAKQGGALIGLPDGLYVDDYSVLGAFFAAPLGGIGFALGSCAVRILACYLFAKATKRPFTALDKPEYQVTDFVLPEDRPASFFGFHGSGNPEDGHHLEESRNKIDENEFHSALHASSDWSWLNWLGHKNNDAMHVNATEDKHEDRDADMLSSDSQSCANPDALHGTDLGQVHSYSADNDRMQSAFASHSSSAVPSEQPSTTIAPPITYSQNYN